MFRIPSGSSYIDLPLWIKDKEACINIQDDGNRCFMYVVQAGVYEICKKQHADRKSHYDNDRFKKEIPAIKYVNFEHCSFPMEIDDDENNSIEEFEKIVVIKYQ